MLKRGEIYFADLSPVVGSEQGGHRPVLIVQNDKGNLHSPTTIVCPLTTRDKSALPTHIPVICEGRENVILLEQIRSISRARLFAKFGELGKEDMQRVDKMLLVSLGLEETEKKDRFVVVADPHYKPRRPRRTRTAKA